jgi:DNA primase
MLVQVTRQEVQRIKALNSLAAVVAERGIELKGRGLHVFARCVFHQDRTPSFVVTDSKGLFHCFGCGVAGDVIGFVMRHDRLSFPAAVRLLARRAGVELAADVEERKPCQ